MAAVSTITFSFAPTIARGAILAGMDPLGLLAVRMVITTALLGATLGFLRNNRPSIDRRAVRIALGAGAFHGFGFVSFFLAMVTVDASIGSLLFTLSPLVVLLLLTLRGEGLTYRHLLRLALGLAGVYLLVGPAGQVDPVGVLLIGVSILTFSVQLVIMQWHLRDHNGPAITFYIMGGVTIVAVLAWLASGATWVDPGRGGWLAILLLAVVSTFLARVAMFAAIRHLGSGQTALFIPFEAFLTVTWSALFLDERLTAPQWVGGALIFLSLLFAIQRLRLARLRLRWIPWTR